MPRKSRGRNRKKGSKNGKIEKEYCPGYKDKNGMWNNGFHCTKFTKKPGTKFCCGDQFMRYCCKNPNDKVATITTPKLQRKNSVHAQGKVGNGNVRLPGHTENLSGPDYILPVTTLSTKQTQGDGEALDIPLIAGLAAGGAAIIIFIIVLVCCLFARCCLKKRRQERTKSKAQGICYFNGYAEDCLLESREAMHEPDIITRDGTVSESDTVSTAMMYPVSPTPTSQTSLPSSNCTHESKAHLTEPLMISANTRITPYKGLMVTAVPTYLHDEYNPQTDKIIHTMKPLAYGQLKNRFPDMYPNEEIDPYTLTSGIVSPEYSPQTFTSLSHGRLLRPNITSSLTHYHHHSPTQSLRSHMHANRYAV